MLTIAPNSRKQYAAFAKRWHGCTKCGLHANRTSIVHARGKIPADVLYVGEAPGQVEDTLGEPFIGPAGKLLDQLINSVPPHKYCIINVVACLPLAADSRDVRPPTGQEQSACSLRVSEVVMMIRPRKIILLGKTAEIAWRLTGFPHGLCLPHPSALLRRGAGPGHADFERCILQLTEFLK